MPSYEIYNEVYDRSAITARLSLRALLRRHEHQGEQSDEKFFRILQRVKSKFKSSCVVSNARYSVLRAERFANVRVPCCEKRNRSRELREKKSNDRLQVRAGSLATVRVHGA